MYFTYDEFKKFNDRIKKVSTPIFKAEKQFHIDNVDVKEGICVLTGGRKVQLKVLVDSILNVRCFVSNPSAIATWNGFANDAVENTNPQAIDFDVEKTVRKLQHTIVMDTTNIPNPEKFQCQ